jgi:hypothetical protein
VTTLLDLFTRPEFLTGALLGAVALCALIVLPRLRPSASIDWGLLLAMAVLIAIHLTIVRRLSVVAGIGTLALGGWVIARAGPGIKALGWVMIAAGAIIVTWRGGLSDRVWLLTLTPVVIVAGGTALAAWSRRLPHHLVGPMVAITAFGVWATVPETEMARALLGAAILLAVATLRPIGSRFLYPGAFALAGTMAWLVASGGAARPASIIGGWACLGLLVILPYCWRNASDLVNERPLMVVAIHAMAVLVASRVIGLWESTIPAIIASAFLAVFAYLFLGYLLERRGNTPA